MTCINILRAFYLLNGHLLVLKMDLTLTLNRLFIQGVLTTILQTWNVVPSVFFNWKRSRWLLNHHPATQLSIMIGIIVFILTQKSDLLIFFTIQYFTANLIFLDSTFWWIVLCCWGSVFWFVQCWIIIVISYYFSCQLVQIFVFLTWKILEMTFFIVCITYDFFIISYIFILIFQWPKQIGRNFWFWNLSFWNWILLIIKIASLFEIFIAYKIY